jgi:hypothetical protein
MREKGESGREEAGEQDAQSGRGRKREKREDGWRGNRERSGAHNRNATQRQEGEGEEEAEQAGDRDEAPLFRLFLSLSLTPAAQGGGGSGTPKCCAEMPGSSGQAVSHSAQHPAKLPPFLCDWTDCLGAVSLGSPPTLAAVFPLALCPSLLAPAGFSAMFRFQILTPKFTMQNSYFPSHQNVSTYMEY